MLDQSHVFKASRWTSGNLFFPVRLEINSQRVARVKPRFFGSNEESIAIPKVAAVSIETGILWADIRIDSAGGSSPMISHGHYKADARTVRELIEQFQQNAKTIPA